jgi:hypothetical protein
MKTPPGRGANIMTEKLDTIIASDEELEVRRKAVGRQCGSCTMCCYILGVDAPPDLEKPPDTWCKHCKPGKGCTIYESRPSPCRRFHCQWLLDDSLDDAWYPLTSKIVINLACNADGSNPCLVFEVDPRRPDRWLHHPYLEKISNIALLYRGTTVRVGQHWYRMIPRSAAENPNSIMVGMGSGITRIIPGKVAPSYLKSPLGDFKWIEVEPTAEAKQAWKAPERREEGDGGDRYGSKNKNRLGG